MGLRINNNLASLNASMNLGRANSTFNSSMAKLSTGLRINSAADGPADLIISEKFRSQITAIDSAVQNTQNAVSMLSTAEGALNEVNSLLNKMKGLALKASQAGTQSPDEIAAYQAEIDGALSSINAISRNTSFGSINLLDGSQAIQTTSVDTSQILVDVTQANFAGASKDLEVTVVTEARRAETSINLGSQSTPGSLDNAQTLKVTGNRGSTTISFAQGSTKASMVEEINSQVGQTGIIAELGTGAASDTVVLKSASYGASEFVTVEDVDSNNDLLTTLNSDEASFEITNTVSSLNLVTTSDKYNDYNITIIGGTANGVGVTGAAAFVDTASKTITITTTTTADTNATVATALNSLSNVTAGTFAGSSAGAISAVAQSNGSAAVNESTPELIITAKDGASTGDFTVNIAFGAAHSVGISQDASNNDVITLTVLTDGSGNIDAGFGTNGSLLSSVIMADSANGAEILSKYDITLSNAISGEAVAVGATTLNAFVAIGSKTSFVKEEGVNGSLEVNGVETSANNLDYTFDNGNIRGTITIDEGFNTEDNSTTFTVSGKGAFFQLGQKAQLSHQVGVGIQSVAVDQLATGLYLDPTMDPSDTSGLSDPDLYVSATLADIAGGGRFDLANEAQTAYDIIDNAINEVSKLRARVGSFISNTLESNINSLGVAFENLTAAESRIRDVDFASETAEFTRSQILVQAGTSVAAQANVATQAALQLLG